MTDKSEDRKITKEAAENASFVRLVSRLKYPVFIKYNGHNIVIPPQGKVQNLDPSKIESTLPNGIHQGSM